MYPPVNEHTRLVRAPTPSDQTPVAQVQNTWHFPWVRLRDPIPEVIISALIATASAAFGILIADIALGHHGEAFITAETASYKTACLTAGIISLLVETGLYFSNDMVGKLMDWIVGALLPGFATFFILSLNAKGTEGFFAFAFITSISLAAKFVLDTILPPAELPTNPPPEHTFPIRPTHVLPWAGL